MRNAYTAELNHLYERFGLLGKRVKEITNEAVDAFAAHDTKKALEIIDQDILINQAEAEIEKDAVQLIALQQPVTSDLRKVITVIKASTDFERIADHARGVAYATKRLEAPYDIEFEEVILKMSDILDQMFDLLLQAIENEDFLTAVQASKMDDAVDEYNKEISKSAMKELISEGETSQAYIEYKSIAQDLERIGDYITNVAELIVYLETGENPELNPRFNVANINSHA